MYTPAGFVDSQTSSDEIKTGEWRRIVDDAAGMSSIANIRWSWYSDNAISVSEPLKYYVNSETRSVEWQWDYVWRT